MSNTITSPLGDTITIPDEYYTIALAVAWNGCSTHGDFLDPRMVDAILGHLKDDDRIATAALLRSYKTHTGLLRDIAKSAQLRDITKSPAIGVPRDRRYGHYIGKVRWMSPLWAKVPYQPDAPFQRYPEEAWLWMDYDEARPFRLCWHEVAPVAGRAEITTKMHQVALLSWTESKDGLPCPVYDHYEWWSFHEMMDFIDSNLRARAEMMQFQWAFQNGEWHSSPRLRTAS